MYLSLAIGQPHCVAYAAVFLDIPKPTLYRWKRQGDRPGEDCGGLTDRHISIEDTMRVKAAKRPGRPKKHDAERVRSRPVNYEIVEPAICETYGRSTIRAKMQAIVFKAYRDMEI
jgi:hypothetical protein